MKRILNKDQPRTIAQGQRHQLNLGFTPATELELKELRAVGDIPEGYVAGWASTSGLDLYGDVVMEGAFSTSIRERGLKGPRAIKLLLGHNWDQLAGIITVLEYRQRSSRDAEKALWIEAQMNLEISYVKDAYLGAKMLGGINFSVGFMLQDYEFKEDDAGGFEYLQINRGELFEVSIVPFPGNEEATMDFIKDAPDDEDVDVLGTPESISEFEKALMATGIVKCRNHAKAITLAVKRSPHLFQKKAEEPAASPPSNHPMLDASKVTALSALVARMKEVITAPVAQ